MSEHIPSPADIVVPTDDLGDIDRILGLSEDRPVFITEDDQVSRVLMSIGLYDRIEDILFDLMLQERYRRSETDGKNVKAKEFLQGLIDGRERGEPARFYRHRSRG